MTQINFVDEWEKKDIDLDALRQKAENGDFKFSKKWKKFNERGVSNLYLIKEMDDDGEACALYAYSFKDGVIDEALLQQVRDICAEQLSGNVLRFHAAMQRPGEWWAFNPKYVIGKEPETIVDYLKNELWDQGIILTELAVSKRKAQQLHCSAVAWGITSSFLKKGSYEAMCIHNDQLLA